MEKKLKHLEFIQQAINRMASNLFLLKGWTVTLIAAMFALAAKESRDLYFAHSRAQSPVTGTTSGPCAGTPRRRAATGPPSGCGAAAAGGSRTSGRLGGSRRPHDWESDYRPCWSEHLVGDAHDRVLPEV